MMSKISKSLFLSIFFCFAGLFCFSSYAESLDIPGQSIELHTYLKSFIGKPSWLIIVRNMDTGEVRPYLFDIDSNENTWVEIIYARHFRILESRLNFGPPPCAHISNFCHLEDGILTNKSFSVSLTGKLTPNRYTSVCHVRQYRNYSFPIVTPEESNDADNESTAAPNATTPIPIPITLVSKAGNITRKLSNSGTVPDTVPQISH